MMTKNTPRDALIAQLETYKPASLEENRHKSSLLEFIKKEPDAFKREHAAGGHITGSAWVVNPSCDAALLIHHVKLDMWLQLGGHCDGSEDVLGVALREAEEESGLPEGAVMPLGENIFDIHIHPIPAKGSEPAHVHYDIRYLFQADDTLPLTLEEGKAHDIRWIHLSDLSHYTVDPSVQRMADKTHLLQENAFEVYSKTG